MRKSVKQIMSLVLVGALSLTSSGGIAQAALANDGDTQQNQVNVSMEVTAQDLGGVTVSIPSEVSLSYNDTYKYYANEMSITAKGYLSNKLYLSIEYDPTVTYTFTNQDDAEADTVEGFLYEFQTVGNNRPYVVGVGSTFYKRLMFDSDNLFKGAAESNNAVGNLKVIIPTKDTSLDNFPSWKIDQSIVRKNDSKNIRVGTYRGVITLEVAVGKPFVDRECYKNTATGVQVAMLSGPQSVHEKPFNAPLTYSDEKSWNLSDWTNDNGTPTYIGDDTLGGSLVVPPYTELGISDEDFTGTFKLSSDISDINSLYIANGYTKLTRESFENITGEIKERIFIPRSVNNIQAGVFDSSFGKFSTSVNSAELVHFYGTITEFIDAIKNGDSYNTTASKDLQDIVLDKQIRCFKGKSVGELYGMVEDRFTVTVSD